MRCAALMVRMSAICAFANGILCRNEFSLHMIVDDIDTIACVGLSLNSICIDDNESRGR